MLRLKKIYSLVFMYVQNIQQIQLNLQNKTNVRVLIGREYAIWIH